MISTEKVEVVKSIVVTYRYGKVKKYLSPKAAAKAWAGHAWFHIRLCRDRNNKSERPVGAEHPVDKLYRKSLPIFQRMFDGG